MDSAVGEEKAPLKSSPEPHSADLFQILHFQRGKNQKKMKDPFKIEVKF